MSIRLTARSAKNPIDRLSGDQKGAVAPSVPGNGRADDESMDRTHNCAWVAPFATNTIFNPSGDIASDGSRLGGVLISSRTSPVFGAVRMSQTARPTTSDAPTTAPQVRAAEVRAAAGATRALCGSRSALVA